MKKGAKSQGMSGESIEIPIENCIEDKGGKRKKEVVKRFEARLAHSHRHNSTLRMRKRDNYEHRTTRLQKRNPKALPKK